MLNDVKLLIDNEWRGSASGDMIPVIDPATGEKAFAVAKASRADLDAALASTQSGFETWRDLSPFDRQAIMDKAAALLRQRVEPIAEIMTREQGKPLAQSRQEVESAAYVIEWFGEEGRRAYGRIIPSRSRNVSQSATREPIGPVAAFTPWNFPINQAVRKISAALAAGCSILLKGPEETPGSCSELVRAFVDAGLPAGAVNLVFGTPAEISEYLIPHPIIRKVSFTGSTAVGKHLAGLAGQNMKPVTMELGGHAPVILFKDCDLDRAVTMLSGAKFRNAGQICVAPTRFLIEEPIYDEFADRFSVAAEKIKVGNGLDPDTTMGPLANDRRLAAVESLVADAVRQGAELMTGGRRIGNSGYFFEPTVLRHMPLEARIMNEEPFGPVAALRPFSDVEEAIAEANRLQYGLAAYAYTGSAETAARVSKHIESGMVSINHHGLGLPELPFGGVKDSGHGTEGGADALDDYQITKVVSHYAA
jgi:succinate-semialdehyde dehydrogenase / glutarate-semialdehyde dehydrogenase